MKPRAAIAILCLLTAIMAGSQAFAGGSTYNKQPGTNCSGVLLCAQIPSPGIYPREMPSDHRWDNLHKSDNDWRMKNYNRIGPYGRQGPPNAATPSW